MFHPLRQSSICMSWIALIIKIWSLIIVSVKAPPTGIYRAKQNSGFKRMACLPGSWHMIECAIFVITGQLCAGWCNYYFISSRSQNRIMTCYEWPLNQCGVGGHLREVSAWYFLYRFHECVSERQPSFVTPQAWENVRHWRQRSAVAELVSREA